MSAGLDPASGSVRAKLATTSPDAMRGSQSVFCSSVPPSSSTWPAMPLLVPKSERNDGVVYPSSITRRASSSIPSPSPPYASEIANP